MILVRRSELVFGLFLLFNFFLIILVVLSLNDDSGNVGDFLFNIFLVSITALLAFFCFQGSYRSPLNITSLVSISIFFFMWARPFLTLFLIRILLRRG